MGSSGIRALMELALRDPRAIRLEVGEPDLDTPPHVIEAAARGAIEGHTHYTSSAGAMDVREAFAAKLRAVNGLHVSAEHVLVTHGAMHGLAIALLATCGPGDEVLVPDPEFPNWTMAATAAGALVRHYPAHAENGFVPALADIAAAVTDRTKVIIVNSPNNPTGAVYPAELLRGVVELARTHDAWVFSDECYEAITYDVDHVSPAVFDIDDRVISFYSFSKSYAMTGWRIGYLATRDRGLLETLTQLAECTISCPSSIGQRAALAAVTGSQQPVLDAVESYRERRDLAVATLTEAGVRCVLPQGAFYLMVDISDATADSYAFALRLLERDHVAVSPGAAFGPSGEGWVRVSLASERRALLEGLIRLAGRVRDFGGASREVAFA